MAYMFWSEELSANVEDVDQQHRQLIAMLNDLHSAMMERKGSDVLGNIIDGLGKYAVYHFSTEEDLFDRYDYPGAAEHKAQHAAFVERVTDFRDRFASGDAVLSMEVLDFLSEWVKNHIRGRDKAFGPYLNERGVY